MNLEPIIQSEISQKEKDKYCIWNLKRWYWWIYFQGSKWDWCQWRLCRRPCVSVTQSWWTLCDPMDCSQAGSSVHGILQARVLKWVAIPFSRDPDPGIEAGSPASLQDSFQSEPPGKPWETAKFSEGRMGNITSCRIHSFKRHITRAHSALVLQDMDFLKEETGM